MKGKCNPGFIRNKIIRIKKIVLEKALPVQTWIKTLRRLFTELKRAISSYLDKRLDVERLYLKSRYENLSGSEISQEVDQALHELIPELEKVFNQTHLCVPSLSSATKDDLEQKMDNSRDEIRLASDDQDAVSVPSDTENACQEEAIDLNFDQLIEQDLAQKYGLNKEQISKPKLMKQSKKQRKQKKKTFDISEEKSKREEELQAERDSVDTSSSPFAPNPSGEGYRTGTSHQSWMTDHLFDDFADQVTDKFERNKIREVQRNLKRLRLTDSSTHYVHENITFISKYHRHFLCDLNDDELKLIYMHLLRTNPHGDYSDLKYTIKTLQLYVTSNSIPDKC